MPFIALLDRFVAWSLKLFSIAGFLLSRTQLQSKATCADSQTGLAGDAAACGAQYLGPQECANGNHRAFPEFRTVVLLIVDAIRFDFAPEFPTVARSLAQHPSRSRLFQFVADAPTTTMQRLVGLTTGGLPTIVDMGRSFDAGIDVQEDNWVVQGGKSGVRMSMVGDDTWVSLFPEQRWARAEPYPSFNVKDIDGCDDHVVKLLPEELQAASDLPPGRRSLVIGIHQAAAPPLPTHHVRWRLASFHLRNFLQIDAAGVRVRADGSNVRRGLTVQRGLAWQDTF